MISVVIPVYNSERSVKILLNQIAETLIKIGQDYEIIPVCDRSPDAVWEVLRSIAQENSKVRPILLAKNAGQQQATLCGIQSARGSIIVTIDDDLEYSPADIELLWITMQQEKSDVVYGSPPKKKHKWIKRQCSKIARVVIKMVKPKLHYIESFRMIKKEAIPYIDKHKSFFIDFEIIKRSTQVTSCLVSHQPRMFGTSNYSALGSLHLWFTFLFRYSWLPIVGIVAGTALAWWLGTGVWSGLILTGVLLLSAAQIYYLTTRIKGYEIAISL